MEVGLKVLEQLENDLAVQRRQRELQLEQTRCEARLAQRQYDAVDPDNRLVASELERRWNEKLESVARLEQAYNQAEQESPMADHTQGTLSQDLPALWNAASTTHQERKQLLRLAIESVQLDGVVNAEQIEIRIRWHSGTLTRCSVKRPTPGGGVLEDSVRCGGADPKMASRYTYADIADRLNGAGCCTAFGRRFTSQHVGCICRRDKLGDQ